MLSKFLKTSTALSGLALAAVSLSAPAIAGDRVTASGNDKVKLEVFGLINRAVLIADDGGDTDVHFVDNDGANSRFGFAGTGKISEDLTVGINMVMDAVSNSTSGTSQTTQNSGAGFSINERTLEIYFASAKYGTLWLGQGDTASENIAETDLSGTANTNYSFPDLASGYKFKPTTVNSLALNSGSAGPTVASTADNYDGLGRNDRIRYDTPQFAGFTLQAGAAQGGAMDIAGFYQAEIGGFQVAASAGYANQSSTSTTVEDTFAGSASVLHSSGISLTISAGKANFKATGRDSGKNYYGKIGYQANLNSLGTTYFSVDYQRAEDQAANGDEHDRIGFGVVQAIDAAATEIYAGFQHYELDRSGSTEYDDINAGILGAQVNF